MEGFTLKFEVVDKNREKGVYNNSVRFEKDLYSEDITAGQIVYEFCNFMQAYGFTQDTINKYIPDFQDIIEEIC